MRTYVVRSDPKPTEDTPHAPGRERRAQPLLLSALTDAPKNLIGLIGLIGLLIYALAYYYSYYFYAGLATTPESVGLTQPALVARAAVGTIVISILVAFIVAPAMLLAVELLRWFPPKNAPAGGLAPRTAPSGQTAALAARAVALYFFAWGALLLLFSHYRWHDVGKILLLLLGFTVVGGGGAALYIRHCNPDPRHRTRPTDRSAPSRHIGDIARPRGRLMSVAGIGPVLILVVSLVVTTTARSDAQRVRHGQRSVPMLEFAAGVGVPWYEVRWVGSSQAPIQPDSAVAYLGANNGSVVVYDIGSCRTRVLPAAAVVFAAPASPPGAGSHCR
jgi:hypothetical protein